MEEAEVIARVVDTINTVPFVHKEYIRGKNSVNMGFASRFEYFNLLRNCVLCNTPFLMEDVGYWYGRLTHPKNPNRLDVLCQKGI